MIRFIFDEHGAFTNDFFIRIDATPTKVLVADTTWLCDFFGTHNADESPLTEDQVTLSQKGDVALLIQLWIRLLLSDKPECYLPVNLSDQSTRALRIIKGKKLFHVGIASTTSIGDGDTEAYFLTQQADIRWNIDPTNQWAIAPTSILTGLNWSLTRLQVPSVPLHYE